MKQHAQPQHSGQRPGPGQNRGAGNGKEGVSSTAMLRDRVQRRLLTELSPTVSTDNVEEVRRVLERIFNEALAEENLPLSRAERSDLFEQTRGRHPGLSARSSRCCATRASPKSW